MPFCKLKHGLNDFVFPFAYLKRIHTVEVSIHYFHQKKTQHIIEKNKSLIDEALNTVSIDRIAKEIINIPIQHLDPKNQIV
jgi:hypothetical protein